MVPPDDQDPLRLAALAQQAGRVRVAVVGGGIAGLVAAWECAKVGLSVTVFEAQGHLGGTVHTVTLDGLAADAGATGFAAGAAGLVGELGLDASVIAPLTDTRWLIGIPGGPAAAPLPDDAILGIPGNVLADDVRAILGAAGSARAYLDRLRPPLTIGHEKSLGALVRARMGARARDRLVAPLSVGVFGTDPDLVDVDLAAPGLNAALTRAGSLSGAVAMLRAERTASPGMPSLRGGMSTLVDALAARLADLGVRVRVRAPVTAVERVAAPHGAGWTVHTAAGESGTGDADRDGDAPRFDAVVVATAEPAARRLLAPLAPDLAADAPTAAVETIVLVVDTPGLDTHPRGTEVLAAPGTRAAAGARHLTATWADLASAASPGRHVLRVRFGGTGPAPATADLDDEPAVRLACEEATALFGVPVEHARVRAWHRETFTLAPPRTRMGRVEECARIRRAIEAVPSLAATGAWLSGSGLAQVVPDAIATADRVRRAMLFGAGTVMPATDAGNGI